MIAIFLKPFILIVLDIVTWLYILIQSDSEQNGDELTLIVFKLASIPLVNHSDLIDPSSHDTNNSLVGFIVGILVDNVGDIEGNIVGSFVVAVGVIVGVTISVVVICLLAGGFGYYKFVYLRWSHVWCKIFL